MKADSLRIGKVFSSGGDVHYVLPHFQREYAWDKANWQTLLDDLLDIYDAYRDDAQPEHFMGALVVINDGTRNGVIPAFKLVDGQQRLTTISLLLAALGVLVKDSHVQLHKRIQRMLLNNDEADHLRFKLLPTTKYGDRDAYVAILSGELVPAGSASGVPAAYAFFFTELRARLDSGEIDPERLFRVITNCLQVVFIDLD